MIKVEEIYNAVGISEYTTIKWGVIRQSKIPKEFGVYIIEIHELFENPQLNDNAINEWLDNSGRVEIQEHKKVNTGLAKKHLSTFWKPDESIIYIGQSSLSKGGIKKRLSDFFSHCPGNKGPHAGGYWVKLLNNIDQLNVHYAICENPHELEFRMLMYFIMKTSGEKDISKLKNIGSYLPFANLTADIDKPHSITGAIKEK